LNCVLTQRLVRVLCRSCRRAVRYPRPTLEELGLDPERDAAQSFAEAVGCEACKGTGFRGRTAVAELVEMTDMIRTLIMDRRPASEILGAARTGGTMLLRDSALEKARAGLTTVAEMNRVTFAE
jgi:type IV pilus assembly protein PilB